MKKVAYIILLALLTACTNLEEPHTKEQPLPEGKYPVILGLSVANNSVTTRISDAAGGESQWDGGEEVAVRINNGDVKKYVVKKDGSTCTLEPATGVTPDYWQSSTKTKTIEAWYPYNGGSLPTSVQSDQSDTGYFNSDILYGIASISFTDATKDLTMLHQVAKVVVNIKENDRLTDANRITNVSIGYGNNLYLSGSFTPPTSTTAIGTWSTTGGATGIITSRQITTTNGYLKSYAAMLIPQAIASGINFIAVTLAEGDTYYYNNPTTNATLTAGNIHTFDIGLKNVPIVASNTDQTIDGQSGTYTIVGTGTQTTGTITIKAPATVTLKNVDIKGNYEGLKVTGDGTVTIKLEGENKLQGSAWTGYSGLCIEGANTHVIIEGSGSLYAKGSCGAAIGANNGAFSKTDRVCGNITIQNTTIVAETNANGYGCGAAIGSGSGYFAASSCGNITIRLQENQTKQQFLDKLKTEGADKVGKGDSNGTCGTITWQNYDGSPAN
ncbi:fimbrillin family protein [Bacteroides timonensis]|uniref:fimbrillin family protein n=1 Tax=Bacteroides timonensis TaxID=1470345 RepID=UPI0004BC620A|nr:fimbrillin family protein [Bacteroides timonensis]